MSLSRRSNADLLSTPKANKQPSHADQGEVKLLLLAPCSRLWCEITTGPWLKGSTYTDICTSLHSCFMFFAKNVLCFFPAPILYTRQIGRRWQQTNRTQLSPAANQNPTILSRFLYKATVALLLLRFIKSTGASIRKWKSGQTGLDPKPCVLKCK